MIILDTHVWYWWTIDSAKLSRRARASIEAADAIGVSITSCVEFARLVQRGRVQLNVHPVLWMREALSQPKCLLLDVTIELAHDAAVLDWPRGDPSDRMIVATAIAHDAPVVSKDDRIRLFRPARAIW